MAADRDDLSQLPTVETPAGDELGSMASLLEAVADAPGGRARGALGLGELIAGKYRVVRAIGEGGMGVVYLARDERLDRDVAIKVGTAVAAVALARIEHEAQALARLQHPNVVVVHEVGEIDRRWFVAMEHVDGGTARSWRAAAARSWREIVALYAAAGDGLAAAHAAGLVHRDIKPDNLLVGTDGRPRVADFGLARSTEQLEARAGVVVGTPAYMPPEQLAGDDVDARADQFSLCAALWEALYDARPFARGPKAVAPPRHVEQALRRGLSPARDDRWPSLAPLLAALRRDPAAGRRRLAVAGVLIAAVSAAVIVPLSLRGHAPPRCADSSTVLAAVWNPTRAAELGRTFEAAGGGTAWRNLVPRIDAYARTWTLSHHAACKATRIDGTQSEAMLDRRMLCLTGIRVQLAAVLDGFGGGGHAAVERAFTSVGLLPDVSACDDVAALDQQTPLPADPAVRAAIEQVLADVATANLESKHGGASNPTGDGTRLVAAATATGWPPLIAQATRVRAKLIMLLGDRDRARTWLKDASALALKAGDDETAAWSMIELGLDFAQDYKPADARPWIELARAIWQRRGERPELGARVAEADSLCAYVEGHLPEHLAFTRRMIELDQRAHGDDPFSVASDHFVLSSALFHTGDLAASLHEAELALAGIEIAVGKDHPQTARYAESLAENELSFGKLDAAFAHLQRALGIYAAWFGPDDQVLITPLDVLGQVLIARGDEAGARAALEHELRIVETRDSVQATANVELSLGVMESIFGHPAPALAYGEQALAGTAATVGADNYMLIPNYILLGNATRNLGRLADSERYLRKAVAIATAATGAASPDRVNCDVELSYTLVPAHKAAEAVATLTTAVHVAETNPSVPPQSQAETHLAYADALWAAKGDRGKARAAATAARDGYAALGADFAPQRAHADDWLRTHR